MSLIYTHDQNPVKVSVLYFLFFKHGPWCIRQPTTKKDRQMAEEFNRYRIQIHLGRHDDWGDAEWEDMVLTPVSKKEKP